MKDPAIGPTTPGIPAERVVVHQTTRLYFLALIFLVVLTLIPSMSRAQAQQSTKPVGSEPIPQPAISAILAAFDKYEVVGMPEAHGMKDLDDFIFLLVRNPAFPEKVNDIEVECGNSLYQPVLDRYIAGEDVPFAEARKVWRDTTQVEMCGTSGFFEQFFPLIRAINQKLPAEKRLRVLAGDPPIDWDRVKSFQDLLNLLHRDDSIASVMEKEVLSKHRKALMLFGTFHLMHGNPSAVSMYEKDYPNLTFVISDLGVFNVNLPPSKPVTAWPVPSLVRAKGTWLGALDLSHFLPPPILIDEKDCTVHNEFPKNLQRPMEDLVDAFLYLGPQDLMLKEQMPADAALDVDYRMELQRREALPGFPAGATRTLKELDLQIVNGAEHPLFSVPMALDLNKPDPEFSRAVQSCLDRKKQSSTPK